MKTIGDIEQLKNDWVNDPCWDIEKTDGFEEYESYLLMFRLEKEKEWQQKEQEKLQQLHDPNVQADEALNLIRFAKRGTQEQANADVLTAIAKLLYVIHVDLDRIVSISDNQNL